MTTKNRDRMIIDFYNLPDYNIGRTVEMTDLLGENGKVYNLLENVSDYRTVVTDTLHHHWQRGPRMPERYSLDAVILMGGLSEIRLCRVNDGVTYSMTPTPELIEWVLGFWDAYERGLDKEAQND